MKILHITPSFYPATYWGGPIYSLYGLCNALAKISGVQLKVLTTNSAGYSHKESVQISNFPMEYSGGYQVYFCRRWWMASFSPGLFYRLWQMIRRSDVVHLTAVYSSPTIPTLLICRLLDKHVVWSLHGALQRWDGASNPFIKTLWERLCNRLIKQGRCSLHVTSEAEAKASICRMSKGTIELIPNGVNVPKDLPDRVWLPSHKLRLLYIGRLHPIKGIENLLHALKLLDDKSFTLDIYGSGNVAYTRELHQLVSELDLEKCVKFHGHVDGEDKINAFKHADLCLIPSFTENFGMVIAEALAHGVPVIASKGTPWQEIERRGCGFWVENKPKALAAAICNVNYDDLPEMGLHGRLWMKEEFNWSVIGHQFYSLYETTEKRNLM